MSANPTTQAAPVIPADAGASVPANSEFQPGGVLTLSGAHGIHDMYSAFLAPLLPVLIERLALTNTAAALLAVFYQGPSLVQPLIGHLGDRYNLRLLVVLAPAIAALMMTLLGVAPGYGALAILLIVSGFSSAGLHAIGPVLVGLLSGKAMGKGMSYWMVGGELARTIGPVVVVSAVAAFSPEGLPWLMPGGLLASAVLYFRLREVPGYRPNRANGLAWGESLQAMRPVLGPLAGVVVSRALLFAAMTIFLPTFLTQEGAGLFSAGVSLAVLQGAGVAGALAGGIVSDRLGRRRVMLAMTIAAPLAAILFLSVRGWLQFPALLLTGLTLLSTTPVLMALVQERAPNSRAFANGIFMAINFATASLALLVIGALGDQFGLRPAFYISALVMLACTPFVWFLRD